MARKSYKQMAIGLAAEMKIELTYEPEDDLIEVWSGAHLTEGPIGQSHTWFIDRTDWNGTPRTDAQMWRAAHNFMTDSLQPCLGTCECWDN